MKRSESLKQLQSEDKVWDIAIIGGGSSGFGVAIDALSRGLSVVLLEKSDFGKGTSSRSTKLLHGGVRYLAQGDIRLVYEALSERGNLLKAAPHLTSVKRFVIPVYSLLDRLKYTAGLKVYDLMSGKLRIGRSRFTNREDTIKRLPGIKQEGLSGGIIYHDGQFDDTRMLIALARTCADMGACLLNYCGVTGLRKDKDGKVRGLSAKDEISGAEIEVKAKMVVNATGVFADKILQMDKPGAAKSIRPSQGIHLVFDTDFLGGEDALMIPETSDGRVLFAVPWLGKLVVGTTDTLRDSPDTDPRALEEEVDFVLNTAGEYLVTKPKRSDVRSVFAGLRPLAAPKEGRTMTKEISRSHRVIVSDSHLVSIVGGKWTTFRKMGEDTVKAFAEVTGTKLPEVSRRVDRLHGYTLEKDGHFDAYGSDATEIKAMAAQNPQWAEKLHPDHPYLAAEVVWAVRNEMAINVEDILSRRTRLLILDARAALEAAPKVAELMAAELGQNGTWVEDRLNEFAKTATAHTITTDEEN